MSTIFSNNLKRFRLSKNLTQEQAAQILGTTAQTISRWECNTTLPDVTMLPAIAKLYCVTIDDLYKESSVAYENYAQRLACIYESTRNPDDFIRAEQEFRKLFKTKSFSTDDLRMYGIIHQFMMNYCRDKAISAFDEVIQKGVADNEDIYWRTRQQKLYLYAQIGKSEESIRSQLALIEAGCTQEREWICLIAAYQHAGQNEKAYYWFRKAADRFPDSAILYICGGDSCKNLKRYDEAFQYWNRALQLDSSYYDAKYSMGFCYQELGEYDKALEIWNNIADELEKDGYIIEAELPKKLATECMEKLK